MGKKLKRVLTGVQSTGVPHLGNILGAIIPAINFSKKDDVETYLFIADFHSLTQIKNSRIITRKYFTYCLCLVSLWTRSIKNCIL